MVGPIANLEHPNANVTNLHLFDLVPPSRSECCCLFSCLVGRWLAEIFCLIGPAYQERGKPFSQNHSAHLSSLAWFFFENEFKNTKKRPYKFVFEAFEFKWLPKIFEKYGNFKYEGT